MSPRQELGFAPREHERASRGIFVRLPVTEAERLDRAAFELRTPKREIIARLVARYLDPSTPSGRAALGSLQGTVAEDEQWAVGRASFLPVGEPEVLTLEQLAELLQLEATTLRALAARGELPGRKIGRTWRFSRRAVLEWLGSAGA